MQGSKREEQEQFIALRTHYLYQANFCRPGKGNEKGEVEKAGKRRLESSLFLIPMWAL